MKPARIKAQVIGMRPTARVVKGGVGFIVCADNEELSDQPGGHVGSEDQAWRNALNYLMRRYRAGLEPVR